MKLTEIKKGHWVDLSKLDKDSVIVDAGACVGEFIEEIREHINCKIIAIEPDTRNFNILKEKNFKNVELINKALVGDDKGMFVTFYSYSQNELGNISNKYPDSRDKFTVKTIKLKDLPKMDYLKMDIEGEEEAVIQSITNKINQMSIEIHDMDIKKVISKLEEFGFKCEEMPHSEIYASM